MINAQNESVYNFFKNKLVIPDYQRQYSWGKREVEGLLDDLYNAFKDSCNGRYYLGNVIYTDRNTDNNIKEIIDGQQRITTLMLILKFFHKSFAESVQAGIDEELITKKGRIAECLWLPDENGKRTNTNNLSSVLDSEVYPRINFNAFKSVLKISSNTRITNKNVKNSKYFKNYKIIEAKVKAILNPNDYLGFVVFILDKIIFTAISANGFGEALDVFSNLNSKGMPLTDIDVFKAFIMRGKNETEKDSFLRWWERLCKTINEVYDSDETDEVLKEIFTIYQFYLLASERNENNGEENNSSRIPKLRSYFIDNTGTRLKEKDIDQYLSGYLSFQKRYDNTRILKENGWEDIQDFEIRKLLDILSYHPIKLVSRPVCIYYFKYKSTENFAEKFKRFLQKYIVFVVGSSVLGQTGDYFRSKMIPIVMQILDSDKPYLEDISMDRIIRSIRDMNIESKNDKKELVRTLLAIYSYSFPDQTTLLPYSLNEKTKKAHDWEIEHIFPDTWGTIIPELRSKQTEIDREKEKIGNKMPLEKELNIPASNHFFESKREMYRQSSVLIAKQMAEISQDDGEQWYSQNVKNVIYQRGDEIAKRIKQQFEKWNKQYNQN